MAYPAQTGAVAERSTSDIADVSEPFRACCVKPPFTTLGTEFAPSSDTVGLLFCCA
jgi:hypothetical protein